MDDRWTDGEIHWHSMNDNCTWDSYSSNWQEVFIQSEPPEPVYRSGQKLKPGEQRPNPFWINYCNKTLPVYNESITNYNKSIMRFRICGAYSRHGDILALKVYNQCKNNLHSSLHKGVLNG